MNFLTKIEFFKVYGKEIFSLLGAVIVCVLNNYFKDKVKIEYGKVNGFIYLINEPLFDTAGNLIKRKQQAYTRSLHFQNMGKKAANRLELVFNYKPMYMNIWPVRHYEEHVEKDDRYVLIFENIPAKDFLKIEILSINHAIPDIISVRSKEHVAKEVEFIYEIKMNTKLKKIVIFLIMLGMVAFIYVCITILLWLLAKYG